MATNSISVVGNLTRDPELRYTNTGQTRLVFGVAVNRNYRDKSGEWQEQTSFFNVIAWGDLGENVAGSLHKGDRVIITGRLEQRSWEAEGGEKRSVVEIVADEIGPSLRWATVELQKTERRPGGGGGGAEPAPVASGGGYADDEEPF